MTDRYTYQDFQNGLCVLGEIGTTKDEIEDKEISMSDFVKDGGFEEYMAHIKENGTGTTPVIEDSMYDKCGMVKGV